MRGANLSGARLDRADLEGALLDDRTQIDAKWKLVWELVTIGSAGRDLRGADLSNAMLSQADLRAADLSQSNLTNARLVHADLDGANLREADLTGTILQYANLSNANLSGAIVSAEQLADAKSLEGAIMPDSTRR